MYVVYRESLSPPVFTPECPVPEYKSRRLAYPVEVLSRRWVPGAHVINIGKAAVGTNGRGLRTRLSEYSAFGRGEPVPHRGGRSVWQLGDANDLLVAWLPTPADDPEDIEGELIRDFRLNYGKAPFANIRGPRRRTVHS